MFLAPSIRTVWKPEAGVTIDVPDDRAHRVDADEGAVELVARRPVATVDDDGGVLHGGRRTRRPRSELAQQDDGEWRITEAPDGIVLTEHVFAWCSTAIR